MGRIRKLFVDTLEPVVNGDAITINNVDYIEEQVCRGSYINHHYATISAKNIYVDGSVCIYGSLSNKLSYRSFAKINRKSDYLNKSENALLTAALVEDKIVYGSMFDALERNNLGELREEGDTITLLHILNSLFFSQGIYKHIRKYNGEPYVDIDLNVIRGEDVSIDSTLWYCIRRVWYDEKPPLYIHGGVICSIFDIQKKLREHMRKTIHDNRINSVQKMHNFNDASKCYIRQDSMHIGANNVHYLSHTSASIGNTGITRDEMYSIEYNTSKPYTIGVVYQEMTDNRGAYYCINTSNFIENYYINSTYGGGDMSIRSHAYYDVSSVCSTLHYGYLISSRKSSLKKRHNKKHKKIDVIDMKYGDGYERWEFGYRGSKYNYFDKITKGGTKKMRQKHYTNARVANSVLGTNVSKMDMTRNILLGKQGFSEAFWKNYQQ